MPTDHAPKAGALHYGSDATQLRSPCAFTVRDDVLGVDFASKGFATALEADARRIRITLRPLPPWLADVPIDPVDPVAFGLEDAYVFPCEEVRVVSRIKSGGVRISHKVIGYPEYVAVTAVVDGATLLAEFSRLGYPTQDLGLTPLAWRAIAIVSVAGIGMAVAAGLFLEPGVALLFAGLLVPVMVYAFYQIG